MSCDYQALANVGILGLSPYQAGKPIEELERELGINNIIKLASNENPFGLAKSVEHVLQTHLSDLTLYPDANGFSLKQELANKFHLKPEQITLGNGSNDLLELIARTFIHDRQEVIYSQYAFIVYASVCQALNAKSIEVLAHNWGHDLSAMLAVINKNTKLIFIANPNNPTGTFINPQKLEDFIRQVPKQVLVVLDEAYTEFMPEKLQAPSFDWVVKYPNLIVCRTFSKAYGLAGLRIGYAVSAPEITEILNRVRQPFNCNVMAQLAAKTILNDQNYLQQTVRNNSEQMAVLQSYCQKRALPYIPSMGNFITIDIQRPATEIYQQLLHKGVIVRPLSGYGMPHHLRVSIGLPSENQQFCKALDKCIGINID